MLYGKDEIATQLRSIAPKKIAVAYLGEDSLNYVDQKHLELLVVSPNFGSNPAAIIDFAVKVGWDKVWLFDDLHSKIYIGNDAVMVGSANLSQNAFGNTAQQEACVVVKDKKDLRKAHELVDGYLELAKKQYPDRGSKVARIEKLRELTNRTIATGIIRKKKRKQAAFSEYEPERDGSIYYCWYSARIEAGYKEAVPASLIDEIQAEVHLSPDDIKPIGRWILSWPSNNNGLSNKQSKPFLLYINDIFEGGADDSGYETLCMQRLSMKTPDKPFDEDDPDFIQAFRRVIDRDEFLSLRDGDKEWKIKNKIDDMNRLTLELKKEYKRVAAANLR